MFTHTSDENDVLNGSWFYARNLNKNMLYSCKETFGNSSKYWSSEAPKDGQVYGDA